MICASRERICCSRGGLKCHVDSSLPFCYWVESFQGIAFVLQPGKEEIHVGKHTTSTQLHPLIQLKARMQQIVSFPAQQQQQSLVGHTPQRHRTMSSSLARQHNQHAAPSHHMLRCCISASSAHVAARRSSRHFRAAAAPDWEFEFDKNPQNTEQPVVRKRRHIISISCSTDRATPPTFTACACVACQTPPAQVMPSPALSPREAVTVQLQAISNNDHPW